MPPSKRGVQVHALIACTNQGGAGRLRKLEQRLLGYGATVDRTGDDFIRYHGKFMIVDRTSLLVLGFNYTLADMDRSRSFGIVTKNRKIVQEAVNLFEADCARHPYFAAGSLLVSPENARRNYPTLSPTRRPSCSSTIRRSALPLSAARACAGSSWIGGAKWVCSSSARRSSRN